MVNETNIRLYNFYKLYPVICEYKLCLSAINIVLSVKIITKTERHAIYLYLMCLHVNNENKTTLEVFLLVKSEYILMKNEYSMQFLLLPKIHVSFFFGESVVCHKNYCAKQPPNYRNFVNMCHHHCNYYSLTNTRYLCRN